MLSHLFLGMSLIGAEWVLYLLLFLSVVSVALMFERIFFFRAASKGLSEFRQQLRAAVAQGRWEEALKAARSRVGGETDSHPMDMESPMAIALMSSPRNENSKPSPEILSQVAQDAVIRARLHWERNLAFLATIGANAPFVGLFGTVLGIIKAFHDLSQQVGTGVQGVTAGVAEALIATAIGILVAIPAVVAFNLFQRRVKSAVAEAEALKSFLIGKMAE